MKQWGLFFLFFFSFETSCGESNLIPTPTISSLLFSEIQVSKNNSLIIKRATLPWEVDRHHLKLIFDEISDSKNSNLKKTDFRIIEHGFFQDRTIFTLPEDSFTVEFNRGAVEFYRSSGLREIDYEINWHKFSIMGFLSDVQNRIGLRYDPIKITTKENVLFVIRKKMNEERYLINVLGYETGKINILLEVVCDRFEIKDYFNDGHEDLICYLEKPGVMFDSDKKRKNGVPAIFGYFHSFNPPSVVDGFGKTIPWYFEVDKKKPNFIFPSM